MLSLSCYKMVDENAFVSSLCIGTDQLIEYNTCIKQVAMTRYKEISEWCRGL
jgi:hypothetical protein